MKRTKGWEKRLTATVMKHRDLPSEYGISDCYLIADDAVEALTGERMFSGVTYTSELGAAKELLSRGFETVEDAFASKFEQVAPSLAQRGDIGVVQSGNEICGGVFTATGFMTRNLSGIQFFNASEVKAAFKVGR